MLMLAIGGSTGMGLLAAWPMAVLVDVVLSQKPAIGFMPRTFLSVLPDSPTGRIVGLATITLGLKLFSDLLAIGQTMLNNLINWRGLRRVRGDLYRKLQALCLDFHRNQPQGDAIYRLTNDTLAGQVILGVFVSVCVACCTLTAILWVLASRNVTLTLMALSITPVLVAANLIWGRRLTARTQDVKEAEAKLTSTIQRSMSLISLVQAFGREAHELDQFNHSIDGTIRSWWRMNRQQMAYNLFVGTTFGVGAAIVFGFGGHLVQRGDSGMTLGDLMIFTAYLGMLWPPLCTLTGFLANLAPGVSGARRVFEILDRDAGVSDTDDARALPLAPRTIAFEGVAMRYGSGPEILRGVDLEIRPGEMAAFVGQSGVGKSTILNLLPRFYDPSAGRMTLDGVDARQVRLADLRRHVALVLQEPVLLPVSIAENIAYGRPGASAQDITAAARLCGAAEFIESLPQGYSTPVAEGGSNLSGGQRQRIAIARALLTNAPIIVLDEPTSALDPEHEQQVIAALRSLKGKRTIVLVSHRLEAVVDADQIFVLHGQTIAEQGTHDQLLRRRGLYARLAGQQHLRIDQPPRPLAA